MDREIELIKELQRKLSIDITGEFDTPTRRSLRHFQKVKHLPITGELDPRTISMLGLQTFSVEAEEKLSFVKSVYLTRPLNDQDSYPNRITLCHTDRLAFEQFTIWNHTIQLPMSTKYLVDRFGEVWQLHPDNKWGYHIPGLGNRVVQGRSIGVMICGDLGDRGKASLTKLLENVMGDYHISNKGLSSLISGGMPVDSYVPQCLSDFSSGIWLSQNYTRETTLNQEHIDNIIPVIKKLTYV